MREALPQRQEISDETKNRFFNFLEKRVQPVEDMAPEELAKSAGRFAVDNSGQIVSVAAVEYELSTRDPDSNHGISREGVISVRLDREAGRIDYTVSDQNDSHVLIDGGRNLSPQGLDDEGIDALINRLEGLEAQGVITTDPA